MEKNYKIKSQLDRSFIKLFNELENLSFKDVIEREYSNLDKTLFITSGNDISQDHYRNEAKKEIERLEKDQNLIDHVNHLHKKVRDIEIAEFSEKLSHSLIAGFESAAGKIKTTDPGEKLGILFLEYDYDNIAGMYGFPKRDHEFEIFEIPRYVKYHYHVELIREVGMLDFNLGLKPLFEFEKQIDEEKLDLIKHGMTEAYYFNIVRLFVINNYRVLHDVFSKKQHDIIKLGVPMEEEVFVFVNEHDCEADNLYVING